MKSYDLNQLRRQWLHDHLNSSPTSSPMHSPPRALIDNDDDHWLSPQPNSNQEPRVRYSGPELARIQENFAETGAKLAEAMFEAQQKRWDAFFKRRSKVQNEIMLTGEKNELDPESSAGDPSMPFHKSMLDVENTMNGLDPESADDPSMPFYKSMLDVENTMDGLEHRDAPKEDSRDMRRLEEEDAAVGKKRKITTNRHRDICEIVAEVMEAKKAMENAESCGCNMS